ncbi:putative autophagy-related cysteine peptidase atg4, partial [Cardiosporidium cionae]
GPTFTQEGEMASSSLPPPNILFSASSQVEMKDLGEEEAQCPSTEMYNSSQKRVEHASSLSCITDLLKWFLDVPSIGWPHLKTVSKLFSREEMSLKRTGLGIFAGEQFGPTTVSQTIKILVENHPFMDSELFVYVDADGILDFMAVWENCISSRTYSSSFFSSFSCPHGRSLSGLTVSPQSSPNLIDKTNISSYSFPTDLSPSMKPHASSPLLSPYKKAMHTSPIFHSNHVSTTMEEDGWENLTRDLPMISTTSSPFLHPSSHISMEQTMQSSHQSTQTEGGTSRPIQNSLSSLSLPLLPPTHSYPPSLTREDPLFLEISSKRSPRCTYTSSSRCLPLLEGTPADTRAISFPTASPSPQQSCNRELLTSSFLPVLPSQISPLLSPQSILPSSCSSTYSWVHFEHSDAPKRERRCGGGEGGEGINKGEGERGDFPPSPLLIPPSASENGLLFKQKWKRSVLLLFPLTLSCGTNINPIYFDSILSYLELPWSLGFVGGKANQGYYYVGKQKESLLFLDPHAHTQRLSIPEKDLDERKSYKGKDIGYTTSSIYKDAHYFYSDQSQREEVAPISQRSSPEILPMQLFRQNSDDFIEIVESHPGLQNDLPVDNFYAEMRPPVPVLENGYASDLSSTHRETMGRLEQDIEGPYPTQSNKESFLSSEAYGDAAIHLPPSSLSFSNSELGTTTSFRRDSFKKTSLCMYRTGHTGMEEGMKASGHRFPTIPSQVESLHTTPLSRQETEKMQSPCLLFTEKETNDDWSPTLSPLEKPKAVVLDLADFPPLSASETEAYAWVEEEGCPQKYEETYPFEVEEEGTPMDPISSWTLCVEKKENAPLDTPVCTPTTVRVSSSQRSAKLPSNSCIRNVRPMVYSSPTSFYPNVAPLPMDGTQSLHTLSARETLENISIPSPQICGDSPSQWVAVDRIPQVEIPSTPAVSPCVEDTTLPCFSALPLEEQSCSSSIMKKLIENVPAFPLNSSATLLSTVSSMRHWPTDYFPNVSPNLVSCICGVLSLSPKMSEPHMASSYEDTAAFEVLTDESISKKNYTP